MQTIQLNNGVEMPVLGYGVFQVPCLRRAERSPAKREKRPPHARHSVVIHACTRNNKERHPSGASPYY